MFGTWLKLPYTTGCKHQTATAGKKGQAWWQYTPSLAKSQSAI